MIRFIPDCLKTKQICKHAVKRLHIPKCFKTQEMCDKAVNIHHSVTKFVCECFKIQEMCHEPIDTCPFVFDSIPD